MIRLTSLFLCLLLLLASPLRAKSDLPCPDMEAAKSGNPVAEYELATAYRKGLCVEKSPDRAKEWYQKAGEQGSLQAQYALGEIYFTGEGTKAPDYPKAKEWYLKAAEQGHGLSQLRLAFLYAENHFTGLSVDYTQAEKWFRKAAEQNAGDARFRLGNFYHHYKNPPDYAQAIEWLTKAAEGGHRIAMYDLATFYREGKAVKKDMKISIYWLEQAGERGVLPAQIALAEAYASGTDVPKNETQAFFWAKKIADQGAAPLFWLNHVADILYGGKAAIPQNYPLALQYYERAASKDDLHALMQAGNMFMEGKGTAKDSSKALGYFQKAAGLGNKEARAWVDVLTRPIP